jgi:hypothetical protein
VHPFTFAARAASYLSVQLTHGELEPVRSFSGDRLRSMQAVNMRLVTRALLLASLALAFGCNTPAVQGMVARWRSKESNEPPEPDAPAQSSEAIDPAVYERAQAERIEFFEREVEHLRADLQQAEDSIVTIESGLRDLHTKADAVSAVAEARIALDRVGKNVPWRYDRVGEAYSKLEEADRQLAADHLGAAVFFASRAQRITDSLHAEAQQVALWNDRRVIRSDRVNLRAGPSEKARIVVVLLRQTPVYPERTLTDWTLVRTPDGRIGWVYQPLLRRP